VKNSLIHIQVIFLLFLQNVTGQNTWSQKNDFAGGIRSNAVGVAVNGKAYVGTGNDTASNNFFNDWWEYDPTTNIWAQKSSLPASPRVAACAFSLNNKAYIIGGWGIGPLSFLRDCWEYDPVSDSWQQKADFGGGERNMASAFSIEGKGYVVGGQGGDGFPWGPRQDIWEYDPSNDSWIQKANFPGGNRIRATAFSINNKGYFTTGDSIGTGKKDFWEFDPVLNIWTRKSDFPGTARVGAVSFSIDCKGYVGCGGAPYGMTDFWEYDPSSDTWLQKANLNPGRGYAVGFSIGNKGYIGIGTNISFQYYKDLLEYFPDSIECATAVHEHKKLDISLLLSPNPSKGYFSVQMQGELQIFNPLGTSVYQTTLNSKHQTLNPHLPAGIYFVRVTDGEKVFTQKLVME
jgi:N-acetylneuraminic acid mutarotase